MGTESLKSAAADTSTRQIQYQKGADGSYTWHLTRGPVPEIGARDVLVQVHAVSIQRADIEGLMSAIPQELVGNRDLTGQIAGIDAAGKIGSRFCAQ